MSRYIDRDKIPFYIGIDAETGEEIMLATMNQIEELPTADVVEVVRCKDCKYYDDGECEYHSESKEMRQYERWTVDVNENDFCSYGERKEE